MEYRNLGATGLKVSSLCLGTMTFGDHAEGTQMHGASTPVKESHAILEAALDAGVNFIDTADVYGQDGLSERVIGDWFSRTGRRHDVVLATKFRFTMGEGPNGTGASRHRIMQCVEDSLRRLQTDHIDLYQIHMQDITTPEQETLRALDDLVRQGKVRYIGCSNYAAYRLMDSLWISDSGGLERYATAQMRYNLLSRELEREHVPLCERHGVGVLPWSPLHGGLLSGKYRRDEDPPEGSRLDVQEWRQRGIGDREWNIVETVIEVAEQLEASPAQVALAWLLEQGVVSSVIIGARKMAHLEDNLGAVDLDLPDEHLDRLDEVSAPDLGYPYGILDRVQGEW